MRMDTSSGTTVRAGPSGLRWTIVMDLHQRYADGPDGISDAHS